MTNEIIALVATLAAVSGASFAVWWNTPTGTPVAYGQLAKALALSAFGALALVNYSQLPDPTATSFTWIGFIISYLFIGAGVGKASNHISLATVSKPGSKADSTPK